MSDCSTQLDEYNCLDLLHTIYDELDMNFDYLFTIQLIKQKHHVYKQIPGIKHHIIMQHALHFFLRDIVSKTE